MTDDQQGRDELITSQPILWAQVMLEEAQNVRHPDARDAILSRVGATLFARFGVTWDWNHVRRADAGQK